jgi:hypothetical protein
MVGAAKAGSTEGMAMRAAVLRLLAWTVASACACAATGLTATASASASLVALTGVPRTFVGTSQIAFSLQLDNPAPRVARPVLSLWLEGPSGSLTALTPVPRTPPLAANQRVTVPLLAGLPAELAAGPHALLACTGRRVLKAPAKHGCVRSVRFTVVSAIPVHTGQPTTAAVTLDASRAAAATIGPGGGTLTTTTADGSRLTLTIPAGALAGDEQVTVTPIASLADAGVTLAAGAQLEPDGLRLLQPATLSVLPAKPVSRAQRTAFAYKGTGAQFALLGLEPGATATIPVLRLGGAGLARATAAQLAGRRAHPPSDPTSAWLQQLASPPQTRVAIEGELGGFYNGFVSPSLKQAGRTAAAFETAAQRTVAWERELGRLGDTRAFASEQQRLATSALEVGLTKAWSQLTAGCAARRNYAQLRSALTLGAVAQALGIDAAIGGDTGVAQGLASCAQLQVGASASLPMATWRSATGGGYVGADTVSVITSGTLQFVKQLGGNAFAFLSAALPLSEGMTSWTAGGAAASCTNQLFSSFSSDPARMYAQFAAKLTVPADLFDATVPDWTLGLSLTGADMASWSITCPPSTTPTLVSQPSGAMAGLGAITGITPVTFSPSFRSRAFAGSVDLVSGQTITAFVRASGTLSVTVP